MLNIIKKSRILTSHIPDSQFPYPSSHKIGVSQPNWKQRIEVCSFSAPTSTEMILPHKVQNSFSNKWKAQAFFFMDSSQKKKKSLFLFFIHSGSMNAHQSQMVLTHAYAIELIRYLQRLQGSWVTKKFIFTVLTNNWPSCAPAVCVFQSHGALYQSNHFLFHR